MPSPSRTKQLIKQRATKVTSIAADTTLNRGHIGNVIKTTVTNIDATLPDAGAGRAGDQYTFLVGVAATTGGATLKVTGTDTINGGTSGKGLINSATTDAVGDSVTVVSDGSNYWTIAQRGTWDAES